MKAITLKAQVVKETEKAIQFACEIDATVGHAVNHVVKSFWVPKKCCKVIDGGIAIAEWFFDKNNYPSGICNAVVKNEDNTWKFSNI